VTPFSSIDEVADLAAATEYRLSLGILTRDVYKGFEPAERIPAGLVHINDQTVDDEAVAPFGGVGPSGIGPRHAGPQAESRPSPRPSW
jgi:benzaldehyde dehydrogenase (NAD)